MTIHNDVLEIIKDRLPERPDPGRPDPNRYWDKFDIEYDRAWAELVAKLPILERIEAKLDTLLKVKA